MASSATVSAPKKRKSFSEYFHSMRGQQLIVTLVFLFVPLVLLFMFTYHHRQTAGLRLQHPRRPAAQCGLRKAAVRPHRQKSGVSQEHR